VDAFRTGTPPAPEVDREAWDGWRARFQTHLDRYGHSVYNLDFLNPVPAEEPAPLVDTLRFYLSGRGPNPYDRQARPAAARAQARPPAAPRLDAGRRALFQRLLRWAQGLAPIREDALADMGLGWPRMRSLLLELGRRLAAAGVIARAEDVFWLRRREVEAHLA